MPTVKLTAQKFKEEIFDYTTSAFKEIIDQIITIRSFVTSDVLLVVDDDGDDYFDGTSEQAFTHILNNSVYRYDIWRESEIGRPSLDVLETYHLVVWTCGDYYDGALDSEDALTLEQYVDKRGNHLREREDQRIDKESD